MLNHWNLRKICVVLSTLMYAAIFFRENRYCWSCRLELVEQTRRERNQLVLSL